MENKNLIRKKGGWCPMFRRSFPNKRWQLCPLLNAVIKLWSIIIFSPQILVSWWAFQHKMAPSCVLELVAFAFILICFFPQNLSQILVGLLRRLLMFHGRLNQQKVAPLLWHQPTNQPACLLAPHIKLFQNSKFIYLYIYIFILLIHRAAQFAVLLRNPVDH